MIVMTLMQVSTSPIPKPKWKVFKKIVSEISFLLQNYFFYYTYAYVYLSLFFELYEKAGRNVRDGLIKAGPAIAVVKDAKSLG